ncbi:hypothetical protein AMJ40_01675 [candidate division TA06 bacterium DG_26]|uniref:UVR domain-containing protein n=1 Tax=candidate division TA06 bacterium DG_26 TaxID=1703771 RepID=A0A0S7WKZ7_UNCT6|nr:MAG: hypothetical protein AMJ40_01675 [candidate division TA06 bacterium DG_26]
MKKKKTKTRQLDLFSTQSIDPLVEKIESLDKEMEEAIQNREFDKAKELARQQEELLDELMNRTT